MPLPWREGPDGLTLRLRVTPNAGRDAIEGIETRDDGRPVLRLRVSAVPDKGRANAAVIALLAKAMGVPRRAVRLVAGDAARLKTVTIAGDAAALANRLAALVPRPD